MILEKQKEAHILQEGESFDSIGMSLDMDSAQILMQMLSKNLYSDAIGSTVRECTSNALDSHRNSETTKSIIVSFGTNEEGNYEFSVEDFGTGLDADDVKNIISKYGKSTKRLSNNQLGMMGLGFKAPLAYSSSFYFVCRKNGIERKYMMYEGEDVNTIDLLYEAPTDLENGVKVIVPVVYADRTEFLLKIKEQLAYFENVYFNVHEINNDFLLHRAEDFQVSELNDLNQLHICLDNVYYPLDFQKLGIPPITLPVGLRFSLIDGIFPTPNRESIRYTQEAKEIILNKIKKVADFFINRYNESIEDTEDIQKCYDFYTNKLREVSLLNKNYNIDELIPYSESKINNPKIVGIDLIDVEKVFKYSNNLVCEYRVSSYLYYSKFKETQGQGQYVNIKELINKRVYKYANSFTGNRKAYVKSTFDYTNTQKYFAKQKYIIPLFPVKDTDKESYYDILSLYHHPKSEWRQRITEFQLIKNHFTDKFIDLDAIEIPQSWFDERKRVNTSVSYGRKTAEGKRIIKLQGEVVGKIGVELSRYNNGNACKFEPITLELNKIPKSSHFYVYAAHEDALKLDPFYDIFKKENIRIITFSNREINSLSKIKIHNLIPYEKFMEGKTKPFKRVVTAILIERLRKKYGDTFDRRKTFKDINEAIYLKLDLLSDYIRSHYDSSSQETVTAMLAVAEQYNLYDTETYVVYQEIKKLLEDNYFIEPLFDKMSYYVNGDDPMVKILIDMMKYHKVRLDYKQYNYAGKELEEVEQ